MFMCEGIILGAVWDQGAKVPLGPPKGHLGGGECFAPFVTKDHRAHKEDPWLLRLGALRIAQGEGVRSNLLRGMPGNHVESKFPEITQVHPGSSVSIPSDP